MKCFIRSTLEFLNISNETLTKAIQQQEAEWQPRQKLFIPSLVFASIFITTFDCFMIHGIRKTNRSRRLNIIKQLFILSCSCGLVNSLFILPFYTIYEITAAGCIYEFLSVTFSCCMSYFDLLTYVTIGALRYKFLRYPMKKTRKNSINFMIVSNFAFSFFAAAFYFYSKWFSHNLLLNFIQHFLIGIISTTLLIILLIFNLSIKFHETNSRLPPESLKTHRRANRRLYAISMVTIITCLPFTTYSIYMASVFLLQNSSMDPFEMIKLLSYLQWLYTPTMLYNGLNALAYMIWDPHIIPYYRRLLCTTINNKNEVRMKNLTIRSTINDSEYRHE